MLKWYSYINVNQVYDSIERWRNTMRLVPTNCAKLGTTLAQDIYNERGSVLLKKGVELTVSLVQKIESNGIYTIYIDDGYSDLEIEEIIRPEVKQRAVQAIKETFSNIHKMNKKSMARENLHFREQLKLKSMEKYIDSLKNISAKIIEELVNNHSLMINLVDIKNIDNYTYEHSLNVAILSTILGIELKMTKNQLYKLFMGALLHDIGKAFIASEIISKKGTLTDKEAELMMAHPQMGYDYLKESYGLDATSKIIALQHHEKVDGTGYPQHAEGKQIHRFARIVAIADVYDAMTSDTAYSKAMPPNEAIEYIMASCGTHFDFELANIFVRKIVPYPEGTIVELSDGRLAIVSAVIPDYPLRPSVKIFEKNKSIGDFKVVDLMKETNITITGIRYEDPNS